MMVCKRLNSKGAVPDACGNGGGRGTSDRNVVGDAMGVNAIDVDGKGKRLT